MLCLLGLLSAEVVYADNLWETYQAALVNNPTFKKAWADWQTAEENLPVAWTGDGSAGSGLFPYGTFDAIGTRSYNKTMIGQTITSNGHFGLGDYTLSITQPIFNYETWKQISRAGFQVKSATATFIAASQQLMATTVQAYFTVLRDFNNAQILYSKTRELKKLLGIANHRLKIGLVAITDVYDVKSRYYRSITEQEAAAKELGRSIEALEAVTGVKYNQLRDLARKIPLVIPSPQSQLAWVHIADKQNYVIHANLFAMLAAREKVKQFAAAGYPTLNAEADFSYTNQGRMSGGFPKNRQLVSENAVGLELNFPFLQGGHVMTTTRQTEYEYLSASDQLQFSQYDVRKTTSQAFISINQDIKQIRSGFEAVNASEKALEASQVSYLIGERSMLDVVIDVQTLYDAMQVWNNDRNDYVINVILLKQQAGTLSPRDLVELNRWLSKNVLLSGRSSNSIVNHFVIKNKLEQMIIKDQNELKKLQDESQKNSLGNSSSRLEKPRQTTVVKQVKSLGLPKPIRPIRQAEVKDLLIPRPKSVKELHQKAEMKPFTIPRPDVTQQWVLPEPYGADS